MIEKNGRNLHFLLKNFPIRLFGENRKKRKYNVFKMNGAGMR